MIVTKVVYDIEVFKKMNMAGFMLDNGKCFWVINTSQGTPKHGTFKGSQLYINEPDKATKAINAVIHDQKWGVPYGFNNHGYDDFLIDDIAKGLPCEFVKGKSDAIIKIRPKTFFDWESYDTREQMPIGFSLKKWEAMSGAPVDESSIPFDYVGEFDTSRLLEVLEYNYYDLQATMTLVNERENYFNGKDLLVKEYGYQGARRYSNGSISAHFLMGSDRLEDFSPAYPKISNELPQEAQDFLKEALIASPIVSKLPTHAQQEAKKKEFTTSIVTTAFGNVFTWGWGGLHSAQGELAYTKTGRPKIIYYHTTYEGVEQWDVASMFPSIIIRDNLLGDATPKYAALVKERLKNKAKGLPLAGTQKIVVNSVYGLLRLLSSRLFNPQSAIAVNVAGMSAIYSLAKRLSEYGQIIQVNTDGIAFKPNDGVSRGTLDALRKTWEHDFDLTLEVGHFEKLIQKDVNNYIAIKPNGKLKLKGGAVGRSEKQDLTKNVTPRIIQVAVMRNLVYGDAIEDTIKNGIDPLDYYFTLSAIKGKTQTGYTLDMSTAIPKRLKNRVNRVYAATNGHALMKEKTKNAKGELLAPALFPDAPEKMAVVNDRVDRSVMPADLDFDYYIELAKSKLAQWL